MTESFWAKVSDGSLLQGDYLQNCFVPEFPAGLPSAGQNIPVGMRPYNLIVMTQSCDIENGNAPFIATCPVYSLAEFEAGNAGFRNKWESVRKGRIEGLHMLSSFESPEINRDAKVVSFREIHSLPVAYVRGHVQSGSTRWRLRSPYLEHFSQAFARFFMRVGLPSGIPAFSG